MKLKLTMVAYCVIITSLGILLTGCSDSNSGKSADSPYVGTWMVDHYEYEGKEYLNKSVKNGQLKKRASYGRIKTSTIGGIIYGQRISTHTRIRKRNIGTTLTRENKARNL